MPSFLVSAMPVMGLDVEITKRKAAKFEDFR